MTRLTTVSFILATLITKVDAELSCDFESICDWTLPARKSHSGFNVVLGTSTDGSYGHFAYATLSHSTNVTRVTLQSPYILNTLKGCILTFDYRARIPAWSRTAQPKDGAKVSIPFKGDMQPRHDIPWRMSVLKHVFLTDFNVNAIIMHETEAGHRATSGRWQKARVQIDDIQHVSLLEIVFELGAVPTDPRRLTVSIDNISFMEQCSGVEYQEDKCNYEHVPMFRCNSTGRCIEHSQVCDLFPDCEDASDEIGPSADCASLPTGTQCNFEDSDDPLCGWQTIYYQSDREIHSESGWLLANASFDPYDNKIIMPEMSSFNIKSDHTYVHSTPATRSGHMLIADFAKWSPSVSKTGEHADFESPRFPPIPADVANASSPLFQKCLVRFYYHADEHMNSRVSLHVMNSVYGRDTLNLCPKHTCVAKNDNKNYSYVWRLGDENGLKTADSVIPDIPSHSLAVHKGWMRVAVPIPTNKGKGSYQLRFVATPQYHNIPRGHFAIDDFSMTPECFPKDHTSPNVKPRYVFHAVPPSLDKEPEESAFPLRINHGMVHNPGLQTWSTPVTGEYLITVTGASGGVARNGSGPPPVNQGGSVTVKTLLRKETVLGIVVGEVGYSPCSRLEKIRQDMATAAAAKPKCDELHELVADVSSSLTSKMDTLVKELQSLLSDPEADVWSLDRHCQRRIIPQSVDDKETARRYQILADMSSLCRDGHVTHENEHVATRMSGGGGGASIVMTMNDHLSFAQLLAIAGGGGGENWFDTESSISRGKFDPKLMPKLGPNVPSAHQDALLEQYPGTDYGANEDPHFSVVPIDNHWVDTVFAQGCEPSNIMSFQGGFGGGGASCGGGGGGGGGYVGGAAGKKRKSGAGGWSFVSRNATLIEDSVGTTGNGVVVIRPCLRECPAPAQCTFLGMVEECQCPDKVILDFGEECPEGAPGGMTKRQRKQDITRDYIVAALISISAILLALFLVLFYVCIQYKRRNMKVAKALDTSFSAGRSALPGEMQMTQLGNGTNFLTEYNPNYEFTCALQNLTEVKRECVTLVRLLGQGAFGEVYEGRVNGLKNEPSDLPVAVKTLPDFATEQSQLNFHMEAFIMSKFHHPNIVRFIGICFDAAPRLIVLELLGGGDLETFLRTSRPKPEEPVNLFMGDLLKMASDVAHGCQYLESNHFIHRDIAARNCLLTTKDGPDRVVKIADFGMSRDIYRADYYRTGGKEMMPVKWMPPEAFMDGIFTSKTDVWSFGVLMWEIFTMGHMPYYGRANQEVMPLVIAGGRLEQTPECPDQIYHIMYRCWHTQADERPAFREIITQLDSCLADPSIVSLPAPTASYRVTTDADNTYAGSQTAFTGTGVTEGCQEPYNPQSPSESSATSPTVTRPLLPSTAGHSTPVSTILITEEGSQMGTSL